MLIFSFLTIGAVPADEPAATALAAASAERIATLAQHPTWKRLLHYAPPGVGVGAEASDVLSTDFYLSADGKTDPAAELAATIAAMRAPVGESPDEHAQCRFPARLIWLRKSDLVGDEIQPAHCKAYTDWLGDKPITGASMIFASGHLGNPSTFYGHMLLRLNAGGADRGDRDQLLGKALNHGAEFPDNENGVAYIFKGLTGGYEATFSDVSFYTHEHRWNQDQLRDVWEYELDLDASQVEMLAAHSWEMRKSHVPYYFLKQNCAFRIAEMVSVVLEDSLLPDDKPWAMPIDVLGNVRDARNGDRPLVRNVRLVPSTQTRFRQSYESLTTGEQAVVRSFVNEGDQSIEPMIAGLPQETQSAVLETLINYYNMDSAEEKTPEQAKQARNALLVARMQRPAGSHQQEETVRLPPHEGNGTTLLQVSAIENSRLGTSLQLRLRGAYNDFLSRAPGSLPYSELSLGDIRVDVGQDETIVRNVEIVRITTLSLSETGLPDDGGLAWRLRFGAEQDSLACDDCMTGYVEGGIGKAGHIAGGPVGYVFLSGRAITTEQGDGLPHVGVSAGLITDPMQFARLHAEVGAWRDIDGDGRLRTYVQSEARFGEAANWDFSLGVKFEDDGSRSAFEARAGFSFYW